jgi:hypothetical protein
MDSCRLTAPTLDPGPGPHDDDTEATELTDPLLLEDVDDVPPKPVNPSVAALDSSGNNSPVLVILDSHIL